MISFPSTAECGGWAGVFDTGNGTRLQRFDG
jgi:hypothetical protein